MPEVPFYLWLITLIGVTGVSAMVCIALFRGAIAAGVRRGVATSLATTTAIISAAWFAASWTFAAVGGYHVGGGSHGVPWLPVAVVGYGGGLLLLTRLPVVRRALNAPGMLHLLMHPHWFRVVGIAFITALFLGLLPPVFAIPAGLGDIAISISAPFVARRLGRGTGWRSAIWFNSLGIADLVVALSLGALVAYRLLPGGGTVQAITLLPLVLIPTVGVPQLLVLHVVSLVELITSRPEARLRAGRRAPAESLTAHHADC